MTRRTIPRRTMTRSRRGMTLLELILATTLLTTLVAAVGIVIRTSHAAWTAQHEDTARIAAANATARHVVRRVRQAQAVAAISDPADTSGSLSLSMPSGETLVWAHDPAAQQVDFGVTAADNLLGEGITELRLIGYRADALTQTTVPAEIRAVECRLTVELPHDGGGTRTVSCWAWLRSW